MLSIDFSRTRNPKVLVSHQGGTIREVFGLHSFRQNRIGLAGQSPTCLDKITFFNQDAFLMPSPPPLLADTKLPDSVGEVSFCHFNAPTKNYREGFYPKLFKQTQGP